MVIFSNDISRLSSFCQALISLLYPFTWQHIFIPVLPQSLIDYVCSPVPFVIGVLSNHKAYIEELRQDGQMEEDVLKVDLDTGKIIEPPKLKDQKKLLPDGKSLNKKLTNFTRDIKNSKSESSSQVVMAKETFVMFFVELFGDYKKYIKPNQELLSTTMDNKKKNLPQWVFDIEQFVETKKKLHKKKHGDFFEAFSQCQMFERWTHELANEAEQIMIGSNVGDGLFEQLCANTQQQSDKKK